LHITLARQGSDFEVKRELPFLNVGLQRKEFQFSRAKLAELLAEFSHYWMGFNKKDCDEMASRFLKEKEEFK
jgi:hypothetical protein